MDYSPESTPPPLIKLKFRDITATCDWTTHEDVDCIEVDLIGWLVYRDKDTVKIATASSEGEYSAVHAVPVGCVTSVCTLTVQQSSPLDLNRLGDSVARL